MRAEDVQDAESLRRWLESLPRDTPEARHVAVTVAHRAAMRVLPIAWALVLDSPRDYGALSLLRAALATGVAAVSPTDAVERAVADSVWPAQSVSPFIGSNSAQSISTAASTVGSFDIPGLTVAAVVDAVYSGAEFAENDFSAKATLWRAVVADATALAEGAEVQGRPLWPRTDPLNSIWKSLRGRLGSDPKWAFWIDWYDRALEGRPQDRDLLTEVALIPSADWEMGAAHVDALIAEIVAARRAAPSKPDARTVAVIRRAVAANREAAALTVEGLVAALETERERIRGDNALAPEARDGLLAALDRMAKAARGIGKAIPEAGPVEAEAAEAIGSWAAVLTHAARHWNREAKKLVLGREADAQVAMAGRLVLGGAVAGVLTAVGLPGYAAVAGGAILLRDKVGEIGKAIGARLPGGA